MNSRREGSGIEEGSELVAMGRWWWYNTTIPEDEEMSATAPTEPAWQTALASSASALRRLASYSLPPELDRRILDLGERKETLNPAEREELLAWVTFTQQSSAEKLEAEVALRRLAAVFPELTTLA
jgi:hypothetical protein